MTLKRSRNKDFLERPYRLQEPEEVEGAMELNLLGLGQKAYREILFQAKKMPLLLPSAFENARKRVQKDFYVLNEKKIEQYDIEYQEIANLELVSNFEPIRQQVPRAYELAEKGGVFQVLESCAEVLKAVCSPGCASGPAKTYEAVMAVKKMLQGEILSYVRTKKTKRLSLYELKQTLVAFTLFLPENEDVLQGLRQGGRHRSKQSLFQNAHAELLFARLPALMETLTAVDPKTIRRKLFSKIAKLSLTAKQKTVLHATFKTNTQPKDLSGALRRIEALSQKIHLPRKTEDAIKSYIQTMKQNISRLKQLYRNWFLTPELHSMQQIYRPGNIMELKVNTLNTFIRTCTTQKTLEFYPTKDWMDMYKGKISSDCTAEASLGFDQLMAWPFFNIRVFSDTRWIGNIYMLDCIQIHKCLMIDRIQIPRQFRVRYIHFFQSLREVFEEIFRDVDYEHILMPLRISNNAAIQIAFNRFKDSLKRKYLNVCMLTPDLFESVRISNNYYILCSKSVSEKQVK